MARQYLRGKLKAGHDRNEAGHPALIRTWAGCVAALFVLAAGCSPPMTVEQQVIAVIREMESRIEAVERRPFMSHVAGDFSGQDGQMNRDQFNALVLYYLRRYKRLNAQLLPIQVTPEGDDRAAARFRVLLTGGEGWLPEHGELYQVETRWRREDGDWLLQAANWRPVTLEGVMD
jgi:hypothetical protein